MADLEFTGEVVEWRGPAPFHFLVTPPEESEWLQEIMRDVTYGWGMIPVTGRVGETDFTTSLWPRKGEPDERAAPGAVYVRLAVPAARVPGQHVELGMPRVPVSV